MDNTLFCCATVYYRIGLIRLQQQTPCGYGPRLEDGEDGDHDGDLKSATMLVPTSTMPCENVTWQ